MKKLEYYHHLRTLGIDEEHARLMVKHGDGSRVPHPTAYDCVGDFARWDETPQGANFWNDYANEVTK